MTAPTPQELRDIFGLLLERAANAREWRKTVQDEKDKHEDGIDWSELNKLAVAHDADQHDDSKKPKKRVAALLDKRGYAELYADIVLRGHVPEQIQQIRSSSSASTLRPGPAGHSPMRAGRDDKAGLKIETIDEPTAASGGETGAAALIPSAPNPRGAFRPVSTLSVDDPLNCVPAFLDRTGELRT